MVGAIGGLQNILKTDVLGHCQRCLLCAVFEIYRRSRSAQESEALSIFTELPLVPGGLIEGDSRCSGGGAWRGGGCMLWTGIGCCKDWDVSGVAITGGAGSFEGSVLLGAGLVFSAKLAVVVSAAGPATG